MVSIPITQSSMHAVYMHRTWLRFALIEPLNVGGFSFSPILDKKLPRQYQSVNTPVAGLHTRQQTGASLIGS